MLIADYIEKKREEKKITRDKLAELIETNFGTVWDLENVETEFGNLPLNQFSKLCCVLDIPPGQFTFASTIGMENKNFPDILKLRREELNISIDAIAATVGFENSVIENLENGKGYENVPLFLIYDLAANYFLPNTFLLEKLTAFIENKLRHVEAH
jgi:transcriptional regulator with XRE-family HTH domain